MVNRIQNRNPGYSDNIFKNPNIEQNPLNSIEGATALKLDEQLEIDINPNSVNDASMTGQTMTESKEINDETSSRGISIENASYIENNLDVENKTDHNIVEEDYTPKLFSEDNAHQDKEADFSNDNLFEHNSTDDEDFEIPAFLRKQKF